MQTINDGLALSETISVVEIVKPFPPELLGRNVLYQRRKKAASYRDLFYYRMNGPGTKC